MSKHTRSAEWPHQRSPGTGFPEIGYEDGHEKNQVFTHTRNFFTSSTRVDNEAVLKLLGSPQEDMGHHFNCFGVLVDFYRGHPGTRVNNPDFLALRIQDVGSVRVIPVISPDKECHMFEFRGVRFNRAPHSGMQIIIWIKAHYGIRPVSAAVKEVPVIRWDLIGFKRILYFRTAVKATIIFETARHDDHDHGAEYEQPRINEYFFS